MAVRFCLELMDFRGNLSSCWNSYERAKILRPPRQRSGRTLKPQSMESHMEFFINSAHATGGQQQGDPLGFLIMIGVFFAIMYFMIIRPQNKRAKEHKALLDSLGKGDEIVTNGGLLGRITGLEENFVTIQVADGVEVQVQRQAVAAVMPKGTMKKKK